MPRGERGAGGYEKWELTEGMESEKPERGRGPKAVLSLLASSPVRALALLYVLLGLLFVLFTALAVVSLQRASAAWEALERARLRSESGQSTAWQNLSEVQRTLDKRLSSELQGINRRLGNVSGEVASVRWKVSRCEAECGRELLDRVRALEERDALELVQRHLAEVRQEQSNVSAALEEMRNLSEIFCTRCPPGWQQFSKTCYFFSTTTKSWLEAKNSCAEFNAHLPVVDTEQENKFLANHIMENRVFWLGLTDEQSEGTWQWVDGRSLSFTFWSPGEPNNVGQQGEDCATIFPNGFWNDVPCTNPEAWICERSC